MRKSSSSKRILILVALLALPGFLYFLLQEKGKNRYKPLNILGPKQVSSTFHFKRGKKIPDTIYHKISDFKLTDQAGNRVGLPAAGKKIVVVNFFYTRCNTVCRKMNTSLERVVSAFSDNPKMQFYSISVDPEYDSSAILKEYASSYHASPSKWHFLTGSKSEIFKLAKQDFLLNAFSQSADSNIVHSSMLVLIDPEKRIRGFYDSVRKEEVEKLMDEIKVLITEDLRAESSLKPLK